MTNLTVSLDEAIVRKARESQLRRAATARLLESLAQARANGKSSVSGKAKSASLRDQLYDGNSRARARKI